MTATAEEVLTIPGYDALMRPFVNEDRDAFVDMRLGTPGYNFASLGNDRDARTAALHKAFQALCSDAADRIIYGVWLEDQLAAAVGAATFDGEAAINYMCREDQRGKGLTRAAVGTVCQQLFEGRNVHSIAFLISPANVRSQNLASKLGALLGSKEGDYDVWRLSPSRLYLCWERRGAHI